MELTEISLYKLDSNEFLQSDFWAQQKNKYGFNARAFKLIIDKYEYNFLVLIRKLQFNKKFAYIPRFPSKEFLRHIKNTPLELLNEFLLLLKSFLKENIFIRIEPAWIIEYSYIYFNKENYNDLIALGFKNTKLKLTNTIQIPDTVILDLQYDEEYLLKNMHKKTRYNINLAKKKGIIVKQENEKVNKFFKLYQETSKRDNISIHSKEYYQNIFKIKNKKVKAILLNAYHENDLLCSIILIITPFKATYLYGASSNKKRNLMATYLTQWEAICLAKKYNCLEYDFFGISNKDDDKMIGLDRFKKGFSNGKSIHYIGCFDFVLKPIEYKLFNFLEKIRRFYYKKIKRN